MVAKYHKLVRFAHNWNSGIMEYWNIGSFLNRLEKKYALCDKPFMVEKSSIAALKDSGSSKMPFPFMLWPIKFVLNYPSCP
jgi:hypothetical protein